MADFEHLRALQDLASVGLVAGFVGDGDQHLHRVARAEFAVDRAVGPSRDSDGHLIRRKAELIGDLRASQHLLGMGHLVRSLEVAGALARDWDVSAGSAAR